MIATVHPGKLIGEIKAPTSKSYSQRAVALSLLHNGQTVLTGFGISEDEVNALRIIEQLGAKISHQNEKLLIKSKGHIRFPEQVLFGESGLSLRMFSPLLSLTNQRIILNGSGSLLKRKIKNSFAALQDLGIYLESSEEYLPFIIQGPLRINDHMEINAGESSQLLTGLLLALAFSTDKPLELKVKNLVSKPYIDMTIALMHQFGYEIHHKNHQYFYIKPKQKTNTELHIDIESDWSSASIMLVAGIVSGNVKISGLNIKSNQADKAILEVIKKCGADYYVTENDVHVKETKNLIAFNFDANDSPDLFPAIVLLATQCKGTSIIKGVDRLTNKESNRKEALTDIFKEMGTDIVLENDSFFITGGKQLKSGTLNGHNDHRIVMVATCAGLIANGTIKVSHADAVNKSYPAFFSDLRSLGANIKLSTSS